MALGADYITLSELKGYQTSLRDSGAKFDTELSSAIASVSRGVEKYCGRQFNDAGLTSARTYRPTHSELAMVDDFHTVSGLVVESNDTGDGVTWTTWSVSDYELEPADGIQDGMPGWPFWRVIAVGDKSFVCSKRRTVRVTARWGWATVPAPVTQAVKIVAAETFQLKDTFLGVAGNDQFGQILRAKDSGMAASRLAPYRRGKLLME